MLTHDMFEAEVSVTNFRLHRVDKLTGKGGGSCIYVHNSVKSQCEHSINVPDCICVIITFYSIKIAIFVVFKALHCR